MRKTGWVVLLFVMGCSNMLGLGYGTDHRAPEVVARFAEDEARPRWAMVARVGFREGRDATVFTAETAPGVFTDVATADADVSHESLSLGAELILPAGQWSAVLAMTCGVARCDRPSFSTDTLAALSGAQITGVATTHEGVVATFHIRAQARLTMGRTQLSLYAEIGENDSGGRMNYTYAPVGAVSEAESWSGAKARYGLTVAYRF